MDTQSKKYEITFHVLEENADAVKKEIEKMKGVILEEKPFSKIALSYPIGKQSFTFCGIMMFETDPSSVGELNQNLKLSGGTVRHMIHAIKEKKEGEKNTEKREKEGPTPSMRIKSFDPVLSNEALEKKIEEILQ